MNRLICADQIIKELKDRYQYYIKINLDGTINSRRSHSDFNYWEVRNDELVLIKTQSICL